TKEAKFKAVAREVKERHENGQPVLVGTVSIERNEYLHKLLETEGVPHQVLNAKNHEREAEIIAQAGRKGAVTVATNMAGRGVDIILGGNPSDEKEAKEVKALGGLHVIGTERHEARRIDNQLRGRSGRQGDPGSSQFYVSLEDDLMRIFGGERIQGIMNRFKLPDDEAIEARIVSGAIESAQGKIEGMHFDARKHVLDYDDVLNRHREIFYSRRREVLEMAKDGSIKEYAFDLVREQGGSLQDLEKREQELGKETFVQFAKAVALRVMDSLWMDHLEMMEALRDSVRLRAYGQQDPLVEYKNEGRKEFDRFLASVGSLTANALLTAQVQANRPQPVSVQVESHKEDVGRNDPCPCGSGKKWKRCGMINAPEHQKK
ncbi:MAG: SEC-C metal-binding domain-containing protein, partial [Candidatus Pacearchaeota archaeon]|nr:SEC-C metal-binding domain-containing protein [Candidatus Pacearchaeota archaeon]